VTNNHLTNKFWTEKNIYFIYFDWRKYVNDTPTSYRQRKFFSMSCLWWIKFNWKSFEIQCRTYSSSTSMIYTSTSFEYIYIYSSYFSISWSLVIIPNNPSNSVSTKEITEFWNRNWLGFLNIIWSLNHHKLNKKDVIKYHQQISLMIYIKLHFHSIDHFLNCIILWFSPILNEL
jgi:hypothetical protein